MRRFIARFRQAPMFSSVYILGAALSVASVMLVAIFLHVKTSNIYPEYSRDRLLYLTKSEYNVFGEYEDGWVFSTSYTLSLSPRFAQTIADSLRGKATVAIIKNPVKAETFIFNSNDISNLLMKNVYVGEERFENVSTMTATPDIFNVYGYEFIEGGPFTDVASPNVVISDRLARRIFGTDRGVIGRSLKSSVIQYEFDGRMYVDPKGMTVCGVFKEGSRLLPLSFAEIIAPVNMEKEIEDSTIGFREGYTAADGSGDFSLIILPLDGVSTDEIRDEIQNQVHRLKSKPVNVLTSYGTSNGSRWRQYHPIDKLKTGEYDFTIGTYPRSSVQMLLGNPDDIREKFNFVGLTKLYGLLMLILLLVPALNLSSLISGNMDSKMSEMGIRKAFGARNSTLLRQVINENLWLTGCGAILGIIIAWICVMLWKDWLFTGVGSAGGSALSATDIMLDPAMLFAPRVFVAAVVICVTLNLLSSFIPAWWALRRPAIDAIKRS